MQVKYSVIRNITSPEDKNQKRTVYAGQLSIREALHFSSHENVRGDLVDAEGRKRKVRTDVHKKILHSLETCPLDFGCLNGGIVIVASKCKIDDATRTMKLDDGASLINGSQTQGELRRYIERIDAGAGFSDEIHVRFELIVATDSDLVAEISISRNFQNDVKPLSMASRRGQLDDLAVAMASVGELRLKESQHGDAFLDTERLIQVLHALTPAGMRDNEDDYIAAYSGKAKCLKMFADAYDSAYEANPADADEGKTSRYHFYLSAATESWKLYQELKSHEGWIGTRIQSVKRKDGEVIEAPDGLVIPILVAMSEFWKRGHGTVKPGLERWGLSVPPSFDLVEFIRGPVARAYKTIAKSKPHLMGRDKATYSMLIEMTRLYARLAQG